MGQIIHVSIKGISPLLQHRYADEPVDLPTKRVSGKRDFSAESGNALYQTPEGVIYQPSSHLERAMMKSAAKFQIGGRGKKTYKDLFQCAVIVSPDIITHKIQNYVVDRRPVIIQRARVMRERPRFDEWGLDFQIEIFDDQVKPEVVNEVLVDCGKYVGIGDYRPKFGRFMVTKFEVKR